MEKEDKKSPQSLLKINKDENEVDELSVHSPKVIHKENILNHKLLKRFLLVEQPSYLLLCKGKLTCTTTSLEHKKLSPKLENLLKEFEDRFPKKKKSKLSPHGDAPFKVLKRVNNNAYRLELSKQYKFSATFHVVDLIPFAGDTNNEAKTSDLRTNPSKDGGNDEISLDKGPKTRAMARRI